jgi:hypothetical protein
MTNKNVGLLVVVFALVGLAVFLNWGRFRSVPVQIGDRSIEARGWLTNRFKNSPAKPVLFLLDRTLRLTSVSVLASASNGAPRPIWHLISTSNSVPTKEFIYGVGIQGMKPAVKGPGAEPLQPGEKYRLLIEAGSKKAQHDFVPVPRAP